MNERSILLSKVFSLSNFQKLTPKKFYHSPPPSFSTEESISKLNTQLPPKSAISVFFTGSPDWPYTDLRKHVNLPQFYEGSKTAISVVSGGIGQRNVVMLENLLSEDCRTQIATLLARGQIETGSVLVKKDDVFFQFIAKSEVTRDSAKIDLVSFSLNGLDKCIRATHEYQQFNKNIEEELKVKGPVLRREDFDATKFRTVSANFQELHPGRLVKEEDILVTNYRFEKSGPGDWQITGVRHVDTRHSWNWFRRFKWKGRLHISIHLKKPFLTVLRYDLMFDVIWISLLIYLQVLAFIMARKITEEEEAKKKFDTDEHPGSSPRQSENKILMQPHLNLNVSSFTQKDGEGKAMNNGPVNPDILTQIIYKAGPT